MNEESMEGQDQVRTHGVNSSDTYQRNRHKHCSISLKTRVLVREGNYDRKEHGGEDPRAQKIEGARITEAIMEE